MKKITKRITAAVIALALTGGAYYAYSQGLAPNVTVGSQSVNVPPAVENVRKGDISEFVTASGTVNAADTTGVYINATQKVSEVMVKLGDTVQTGDSLVKYDIDYSKKELENNLATQQISLRSANLSLNSLTAQTSETEMLQLQNNVSTAEKSVLDAKNNLNSTQKQIAELEIDLEEANTEAGENERLLSVGAITQEAYDESLKVVTDTETSIKDSKANIESQEKAVLNAEASLNAANLNLENAGDPLNAEADKINYQKQQNEIAKAQLAIENVEDQISDLIEESISLTSGTVIEINVEEGSVVNDETNIMKIADLSSLIVNANVSEYDAPLLALGQKVTITTDAIANMVYNGEITYISPVADVTSTYSGSETTVSIEVTISNPDGILKPGYSVDMEILVVDEKDVDIVSLSAVQKDNEENKYYVYTVDADNMIHKTFVEMGAYDDMNTQIKSGVKTGDTIVSSPTSAMRSETGLELYSSPVEMPEAALGQTEGSQGNIMMMPGNGNGGGQRPSSGGQRIMP
jgi:RND family efflux transporter MFP subunit